MVLFKNAKIGGLYFLSFLQKINLDKDKKMTECLFLVKLINIAKYGGKTSPIIKKLIKLKPDTLEYNNLKDTSFLWWNLFALDNKERNSDIKLLIDKSHFVIKNIFQIKD